MGLSNCLFFGVWRWITRGGYLVLRRSHYGWWPHILWCEHLRDAQIEHYVPLRYSMHFAPVHKLLFRGYVSRIDLAPDTTKPEERSARQTFFDWLVSG